MIDLPSIPIKFLNMPKTRGQSALEYVLTYGWAILVVMVIGIVMWQIGLLDFGGSAPVSEGFQQLKPLLATCRMNDVLWEQYYGTFQCAFTNTLQTGIVLENINVTVDGKYCARMMAGITLSGESVYVYRNCEDYTGPCDEKASCTGPLSGVCECVPGSGGTDCHLIVPRESTFFVGSYSWEAWHDAHPNEPCWDINPGNRYDAFVDITYDITLGGKTVTKHSSGAIRGAHA